MYNVHIIFKNVAVAVAKYYKLPLLNFFNSLPKLIFGIRTKSHKTGLSYITVIAVVMVRFTFDVTAPT